MSFWLPGNLTATTGSTEGGSGLTGVYVLDTCWQILVGVQVDGDERRVFALDVTGFAGLDGVKLVLSPQTCQLQKKPSTYGGSEHASPAQAAVSSLL